MSGPGAPTAAGVRDPVDELLQSRNEPVVPDAEQRSAGDVSNASGLHDDRPRRALREPSVPVEDVRRDGAVLRRGPRHHRGNQVRSRRCRRPVSTGENQRDRAAWAAVGHRAGGTAWRNCTGGCYMNCLGLNYLFFDAGLSSLADPEKAACGSGGEEIHSRRSASWYIVCDLPVEEIS